MLARTPKKTTAQVIDEIAGRLGPFPVLTQPVPIVGTSTYAPEPCSNPRERRGAAYHNPTCACGWMMGEHSDEAISLARRG